MNTPSEEAAHGAVIFNLITGFWSACAVAVAARMGIADQLTDGSRSASEIAQSIGADPPALYRLLRALASIGVLTLDDKERFGLTAVGSLLRSGVPGSVRAAIASELDTAHYRPWGHLEECIRTGEPAFQKVFSVPPWRYYREVNPAEGKLFGENMTALSEMETRAILAAYSFADARRIVDVGGAHGAFLAAVLQRVPQARGVLLDHAQVVDQAKATLQSFGVAERVECMGGDFFAEVPAGGDLYLLKHILHDWNDEECIKILGRVREAMARNARVVVAEMPVLQGGETAPLASLFDLNMLVILGGKERTAKEYATLFERSGLRLTGVTSTNSPLAIIEARMQ